MIQYKKLTKEDIILYQSIVLNFREQIVTKEKAERFLSNPMNYVYCAYEEQNAVGYLLGYRHERMDNKQDMLEFYHLFVLEEYQRRGIASTLLTMGLTEAREDRLHYVYLITQNDNEPAKALYEKHGGYNHPKDKEVYFWYITGRPITDDPKWHSLEQE